jgi:hypothetical protein
VATTYYVQPGPLGDVFTDLRLRPGPPAIGVVGLGAGTIATYAQPGDSLMFFEIDPAVVRIAENPRYFTFLADAPVKSQIVLGDARLSLADVPPASFDVLILDAFSSDAVPVHLLTREALTTYMRAMRLGGVVVYHVSNRYYDLAPAIAATARSIGLEGLSLAYEPGPANKKNLAATGSTWVVVGRLDDVDRFRPRGWDTRNGGPVLTDDYADLLRLLRFGG